MSSPLSSLSLASYFSLSSCFYNIKQEAEKLIFKLSFEKRKKEKEKKKEEMPYAPINTVKLRRFGVIHVLIKDF